MNIQKMKTSEIHALNRYYFYIGFLFLPFFWLVNVLWIGPHAYWRMPESQEKKDILRITLYSGIGSLFWIMLVIAWTVFFAGRYATMQWDSMVVRLPSS
jgi:presenilin enhancer 2